MSLSIGLIIGTVAVQWRSKHDW